MENIYFDLSRLSKGCKGIPKFLLCFPHIQVIMTVLVCMEKLRDKKRERATFKQSNNFYLPKKKRQQNNFCQKYIYSFFKGFVKFVTLMGRNLCLCFMEKQTRTSIYYTHGEADKNKYILYIYALRGPCCVYVSLSHWLNLVYLHTPLQQICIQYPRFKLAVGPFRLYLG